MRFRSFATNVDTHVCGKQCAPYDVPCNYDKYINNCGGAIWDPLFGVPQTDKDRLLEKGISYAEYDPVTGVKVTSPPRGGTHTDNCSKDCGSILDIPCYFAKMTGGCGGSTEFCKVVSLPGCESWYKYLPIAAIAVVGLLIFLVIRRR